jgi:hypothetical protein
MTGTRTAAQTVQAARERAQLSQGELARRSGVPQSHISLIESGRVQPTEATVRRLVTAARVRPSVVLRRYREDVLAAAARRHGHHVRVFGSVARGDDREDSDIDLLIDFDQGTSIFTVAGLAQELEDLLGVHVDLVSNGGLASHALRRARLEAVSL